MTRIALAPSKMVLLMSLVITGAHASPEQPLIKDTPLYLARLIRRVSSGMTILLKKAKLKKKRFCHQPVLLARLQKRKW